MRLIYFGALLKNDLIYTNYSA